MRLDSRGVDAFTKEAPMNTDDNMRLGAPGPRTLYRDDVDSIPRPCESTVPTSFPI
jgi:hypothetical protein